MTVCKCRNLYQYQLDSFVVAVGTMNAESHKHNADAEGTKRHHSHSTPAEGCVGCSTAAEETAAEYDAAAEDAAAAEYAVAECIAAGYAVAAAAGCTDGIKHEIS